MRWMSDSFALIWMTETFFFTTLLSRGDFGARFMGKILRRVLAPSILEGAKSQNFLYTLVATELLLSAQILAPKRALWLHVADSTPNNINHLDGSHKSLHHTDQICTPSPLLSCEKGLFIRLLAPHSRAAQILAPFAQISTPIITNPYTFPHKSLHLSSQILTP